MKKIPLLKSFKLKWGEDASPEDWEETQYARGWSTVGDSPPTVEQFDGVHNIQDAKSNYLYRQLQSVFDDAGIKADAADDKTLLQAFLAVLRKTLSTGDYASKSEMRKKLDKTGKAADSDKLDGHDANYFATIEQLKYKEKYDIGRNKRIEENRKAIGGKLDKTAKAADADKLDGHDSGYFATASAVDGKVRKTGDRMTGQLDFMNLSNAIRVIDEVKTYSPTENKATGLIFSTIKKIDNLECHLYLEQVKNMFHAVTLRLSKKTDGNLFWNFRNDGHLYGPHGKIVNAEDEAYSIGSYTIAIVRSTKSFTRNGLVSGAEFFDSNIGGDLGNDFSAERWWVGNRNVGGLPGTWRVMNPINSHGDYRNNSAWCTINLIKRVA